MTCNCMNSKCFAARQCLGAPGGQGEIEWMQSAAKVVSKTFWAPTSPNDPRPIVEVPNEGVTP